MHSLFLSINHAYRKEFKKAEFLVFQSCFLCASIDAYDVQINFCLDDENDELIFCSCDGETFIIDKYNNIVNFKLGKDISAFCAGIICQFF